MAQALPVAQPQAPAAQPAQPPVKVVPGKGKATTPESVAVLSLFFG